MTTQSPHDPADRRATGGHKIAVFVAAAMALVLLVAACGETATETVPGDPGDSGDPTETTSTTDGEPGDGDEPGAVELRTYEIDGADVRVRSALDELPDQATTVEFTSTLIDSGGGLELCLGGVAESLPPQCGGPVVEGLDPTGWTETQSGVTWGDRSVVVEWPPTDDETLTLISDSDAVWPEGVERHDFSVPPRECADITNSADTEVIARFADANQDRTGTVWVVDNGRITVLPVVEEHLNEVRAELIAQIAEGVELCLVPVRYSTAELRAAQDQLTAAEAYGPPLWLLGSGSGGVDNAVSVTVAVADRTTVEAVTALVDDPAMLRIDSMGAILDGD